MERARRETASNQAPSVELVDVERYRAGLQRGQGQEVPHETAHAVGLVDDVVDEGGAIGGHEVLALEDLRRRADDRRRRLELVGGRRHEAPLRGERLADGHQGPVGDDERDDDRPDDAEQRARPRCRPAAAARAGPGVSG